jgi:hypothetical protein
MELESVMMVTEISHYDAEPAGLGTPAKAAGLFRQRADLAAQRALATAGEPEAEPVTDLQAKARARRLKALARIADEADEIVKSFPPRRPRPVQFLL